MANYRRGEIDVEIDGQIYVLCLTLGALAELEQRLKAENLVELGARFERGHLSARDIIAIIGAGLRGAGASITDEAVGRMQVEGGLTRWASIAATLLQASFGQGEVPTPNP